MLLNLDVWSDVIDFFECPEDKDTLRSLALTSRSLSDLALVALWRNRDEGTMLEIVAVINSFTPSLDEPFLEYIRERGNSGENDNDDGNDDNDDDGDDDEDDDDEEDEDEDEDEEEGEDNDDEEEEEEEEEDDEGTSSWVLNKPLPCAARTRTLEYLSWIRELAVCQDGPPYTEEPIWPILSASLRPHQPLLPNLRRLKIEYYIYNRNEYLIPLLSPSLKVLMINCERRPKARAIPTILNLAKTSGCDLQEFVYDGRCIRDLPEAITPFQALQSVTFPLKRIALRVPSITIVEFFTSLSSLRSLICHLDMFLWAEDKNRLYHTCLQKIEIMVTPGSLRKLLQRCVFPSVTKVHLLRDRRIPSLEGLETSCPNLRKLRLNFHSSSRRIRGNILGFKHIASLSYLPIKTLHVEAPAYDLYSSQLDTFARSWPNLHTFNMYFFTVSNPLPLLATFSAHCPCLEVLYLKLHLCGLLYDILKIPDLIETRITTQGCRSSHLRKLYFGCNCRHRGGLQLPRVTTAERRELAEYLYLLFPSLEELEFIGTSRPHPIEVASIREILLELRKEREGSGHLD